MAATNQPQRQRRVTVVPAARAHLDGRKRNKTAIEANLENNAPWRKRCLGLEMYTTDEDCAEAERRVERLGLLPWECAPEACAAAEDEDEQNIQGANKARSSAVAQVFLCIFLWYPGMCQRSFGMLVCRQLTPSISVLRDDYTVECHNYRHRLHAWFAYVFIGLSVFIPICVVWQFHSRIKEARKVGFGNYIDELDKYWTRQNLLNVVKSFGSWLCSSCTTGVFWRLTNEDASPAEDPSRSSSEGDKASEAKAADKSDESSDAARKEKITEVLVSHRVSEELMVTEAEAEEAVHALDTLRDFSGMAAGYSAQYPWWEVRMT